MNADTADDRPTAIVHRIELVLTNGPEAGRRIQIKEVPCVLGRGGRSGVVLADPNDPPALSREHATLASRGARMLITDHSVNGTCVGDRWLARGETAEIRPGDKIRFGPTLVVQLITNNEGHPLDQATTVQEPVDHSSYRKPVIKRKSLRESISSIQTLRESWHRVELNRGAAGPDNVSVHQFALDAERHLRQLRSLLLRGRYEPVPPRLLSFPKRSGGVRTIAILSVRDRIVQQAIHSVLQPMLEPHFPACSFAYRPGVCAHHALSSVEHLLTRGLTWVAETDIQSFFDSISHRILMNKLSEHMADIFTLTLVSRCLAAGATGPGIGIPQGAATSPLFSNLYLAEYDRHMLDGGYNLIRYGDDMLFLCLDKSKAQQALMEAEGFLRSKLNLSLSADKTSVRPLEAGFTFLGFRFDNNGRRPSPKAIASLHERLDEASPAQAATLKRGWRNYCAESGTGLRLQ